MYAFFIVLRGVDRKIGLLNPFFDKKKAASTVKIALYSGVVMDKRGCIISFLNLMKVYKLFKSLFMPVGKIA